MADLSQDKLVMFQHRNYLAFFTVFAFLLPTIVPYILWEESLVTAFFISGLSTSIKKCQIFEHLNKFSLY